MSRYEPIDDDAFEPPETPRRRGVLPVFVAALALGGFAGLVWYAYQDGATVDGSGGVPTLRAADSAIKERPADPGGDEAPHQDKLVYQTIGDGAGQTDATAPTFRDTPEEPVERDVRAPAVPPPPAPVADGEAEDLLDAAPGEADGATAGGTVPHAGPAGSEDVAPAPAEEESTAATMLTGPEGAERDTTETQGHGEAAAPAKGMEATGAAAGPAGAEDSSPGVEEASPGARRPLSTAPAPIPETADTATDGMTQAERAMTTDRPAEEPLPEGDTAMAESRDEETRAPTSRATETPEHATEARAGHDDGSAAGHAPRDMEAADTGMEEAETAAATETEATPPAMEGGFRVQISAMRSEAGAEDVWAAAVKRYPELLGDLELMIQRIDLGQSKGVFYRVQAGPLTEDGARKLCRELKRRGQACLVAEAKAAPA